MNILPDDQQPGNHKLRKQRIFSLPRGLPIAWGEVIPPLPGYKNYQFRVIDCPYCAGEHFHGWPGPDDPEQKGGIGSTRVSHCTSIRIGMKEINTGGGEYTLLPKEYKPRRKKS